MKNCAYYVLAVLFLVAFVTTFNYSCGGGGGSDSGSSAPTTVSRFLYVWGEAYNMSDGLNGDDTTLQNELIAFCKQMGISGLFFYTDLSKIGSNVTYRTALQNAISHLKDNDTYNIPFVWALDGKPEWALLANHSTITGYVNDLLLYKDNGTLGFDGLDLDIEIYLNVGWEPGKALDPPGAANFSQIDFDIATQYLNLMKQIKNNIAGKINLSVAIPYWMDKLNEHPNDFILDFNGTKKYLHKHIQDVCKVNVMDYLGDSIDNTKIQVSDEIQYGDGGSVRVTLETNPAESAIAISSNQKLEEIISALKDAYGTKPSFSGVAIHHYTTYKQLASSSVLGPVGTFCLTDSIVVGDVNNDGLNEIVVGWYTPGSPSRPHSVVVYKWSGSVYAQVASISIPTDEACEISVGIGDVNGDGQKEIVVMNASPSDQNSNGKIRVYKYSAGNFQLLWTGNLSQGFRQIAIGNLDTDTAEEIVIGNSYYDRTMYVYDYQGSNVWNKVTIESVGEDNFKVKIADVDNDGQNEIVAGFGVWSPYSVRIYKYIAGTYQKIWSYSFTSVSPYGPVYYLDAGDIDNDGKNEILVTEWWAGGEGNANDVFVFEHGGGTTWNLSWSKNFPGKGCNLPYIGRIKNSGINEFAFLNDDIIYVYKWTGSDYAVVGSAGGWTNICSITGGDTDNDGAHETIIGRQNIVYIKD